MSRNNMEWQEADIDTTARTSPYFSRKINYLADDIEGCARSSHFYCAVTGIAPGRFEPIYSQGVQPSWITDDIENELTEIRASTTLPAWRFQEGEWFVPLVGQNEFFGFLKFLNPASAPPPSELVSRWSTLIEEISDHNYTRRVQFLSESFSKGADDSGLSKFSVESRITELAALSFGADGVVFRRYDARNDVLNVAVHEGAVPSELLAPRRPNEGLSGALLHSSGQNWSTIEIGTTTVIRGCPVSQSGIDMLRQAGVKAAISARLDNPIRPGAAPFGTLAYMITRPSQFSWRDVTLFLGFCKRAADALALAEEALELRDRNRQMEAQSNAFTQAEVATLLVHDISHKVFHVGEDCQNLVEVVSKQMKNLRSQVPTEVVNASSALNQSIKELHREVSDLKVVGRWDDSGDKEFGVSTFLLLDVLEELELSMRYPLRRYNITMRLDVPKDLTLIGARRVLYHVLLNLLLNSIDAVRQRGRSASVNITATSPNDDIVRIRFWDTGPGLNLASLPDGATSIFKIGVSTKKTGTGLGLPMTRNLLQRYFNGSIALIDRQNAVFELQLRRANG